MSKGSDRKPTVRPVSRDPNAGKGMSALRGCNCIEEVDRRLRMGWSSADVVRMIQDEYKELNHLSTSYVKKMVDLYRKEIPPSELALTTTNTKVAGRARRAVNNGLDELHELERLYHLQMKRVEIDVGNEEKINKLFPTTGREIFVAMKLLKQSADLKMDLGLLKRQLGEVSVVGENAAEISSRYNDETVGQVLTDPDSRRKVFGMVNTLLRLGGKADIDAAELIDSAASQIIDVPAEEEVPAKVSDGD